MKIRITKELPVPEEVRPAIGSEHEVSNARPGPRGGVMYFFPIGITQIAALDTECEVVEE